MNQLLCLIIFAVIGLCIADSTVFVNKVVPATEDQVIKTGGISAAKITASKEFVAKKLAVIDGLPAHFDTEGTLAIDSQEVVIDAEGSAVLSSETGNVEYASTGSLELSANSVSGTGKSVGISGKNVVLETVTDSTIQGGSVTVTTKALKATSKTASVSISSSLNANITGTSTTITATKDVSVSSASSYVKLGTAGDNRVTSGVTDLHARSGLKVLAVGKIDMEAFSVLKMVAGRVTVDTSQNSTIGSSASGVSAIASSRTSFTSSTGSIIANADSFSTTVNGGFEDHVLLRSPGGATSLIASNDMSIKATGLDAEIEFSAAGTSQMNAQDLTLDFSESIQFGGSATGRLDWVTTGAVQATVSQKDIDIQAGSLIHFDASNAGKVSTKASRDLVFNTAKLQAKTTGRFNLETADKLDIAGTSVDIQSTTTATIKSTVENVALSFGSVNIKPSTQTTFTSTNDVTANGLVGIDSTLIGGAITFTSQTAAINSGEFTLHAKKTDVKVTNQNAFTHTLTGDAIYTAGTDIEIFKSNNGPISFTATNSDIWVNGGTSATFSAAGLTQTASNTVHIRGGDIQTNGNTDSYTFVANDAATFDGRTSTTITAGTTVAVTATNNDLMSSGFSNTVTAGSNAQATTKVLNFRNTGSSELVTFSALNGDILVKAAVVDFDSDDSITMKATTNVAVTASDAFKIRAKGTATFSASAVNLFAQNKPGSDVKFLSSGAVAGLVTNGITMDAAGKMINTAAGNMVIATNGAGNILYKSVTKDVTMNGNNIEFESTKAMTLISGQKTELTANLSPRSTFNVDNLEIQSAGAMQWNANTITQTYANNLFIESVSADVLFTSGKGGSFRTPTNNFRSLTVSAPVVDFENGNVATLKGDLFRIISNPPISSPLVSQFVSATNDVLYQAANYNTFTSTDDFTSTAKTTEAFTIGLDFTVNAETEAHFEAVTTATIGGTANKAFTLNAGGNTLVDGKAITVNAANGNIPLTSARTFKIRSKDIKFDANQANGNIQFNAQQGFIHLSSGDQGDMSFTSTDQAVQTTVAGNIIAESEKAVKLTSTLQQILLKSTSTQGDVVVESQNNEVVLKATQANIAHTVTDLALIDAFTTTEFNAKTALSIAATQLLDVNSASTITAKAQDVSTITAKTKLELSARDSILFKGSNVGTTALNINAKTTAHFSTPNNIKLNGKDDTLDMTGETSITSGRDVSFTSNLGTTIAATKLVTVQANAGGISLTGGKSEMKATNDITVTSGNDLTLTTKATKQFLLKSQSKEINIKSESGTIQFTSDDHLIKTANAININAASEINFEAAGTLALDTQFAGGTATQANFLAEELIQIGDDTRPDVAFNIKSTAAGLSAKSVEDIRMNFEGAYTVTASTAFSAESATNTSFISDNKVVVKNEGVGGSKQISIQADQGSVHIIGRPVSLTSKTGAFSFQASNSGINILGGPVSFVGTTGVQTKANSMTGLQTSTAFTSETLLTVAAAASFTTTTTTPTTGTGNIQIIGGDAATLSSEVSVSMKSEGTESDMQFTSSNGKDIAISSTGVTDSVITFTSGEDITLRANTNVEFSGSNGVEFEAKNEDGDGTLGDITATVSGGNVQLTATGDLITTAGDAILLGEFTETPNIALTSTAAKATTIESKDDMKVQSTAGKIVLTGASAQLETVSGQGGDLQFLATTSIIGTASQALKWNTDGNFRATSETTTLFKSQGNDNTLGLALKAEGANGDIIFDNEQSFNLKAQGNEHLFVTSASVGAVKSSIFGVFDERAELKGATTSAVGASFSFASNSQTSITNTNGDMTYETSAGLSITSSSNVAFLSALDTTIRANQAATFNGARVNINAIGTAAGEGGVKFQATSNTVTFNAAGSSLNQESTLELRARAGVTLTAATEVNMIATEQNGEINMQSIGGSAQFISTTDQINFQSNDGTGNVELVNNIGNIDLVSAAPTRLQAQDNVIIRSSSLGGTDVDLSAENGLFHFRQTGINAATGFTGIEIIAESGDMDIAALGKNSDVVIQGELSNNFYASGSITLQTELVSTLLTNTNTFRVRSTTDNINVNSVNAITFSTTTFDITAKYLEIDGTSSSVILSGEAGITITNNLGNIDVVAANNKRLQFSPRTGTAKIYAANNNGASVVTLPIRNYHGTFLQVVDSQTNVNRDEFRVCDMIGEIAIVSASDTTQAGGGGPGLQTMIRNVPQICACGSDKILRCGNFDA